MKIALTLVTAIALASTAHATTFSATDWGSHDTLEIAAPLTAVGDFEDRYLFTLPSDVQLFSSAVSVNINDVLGLSGGKVTLFREAGAVDTEAGSYSFGPATGDVTHSFGSPLAGAYYYLVTGTGTGSLGGAYVLTSTVLAVPEPETAAMLLSGLGALVFLTKRRRHTS